MTFSSTQNSLDRRRLLALIGATAAASLPLAARGQQQGNASPDADAALQDAVANPQRSAANRNRDAARHPVETLRFFGLRPEMTVIELSPGGGWYTEILAPYLRERGQLIVAHYGKDSADAGRRRARAAFEARLAAAPALYDRVVLGTLPEGGGFTDIAPAGGADMVLTFRNIHNWLEAGHLDASLRAFAAVLKPDGVLGVEEHRAAPGTSVADMDRSGYVTEALLTERAGNAGLRLAARSEINANPRDTKDHPGGVWSLPPTLSGKDVDRARYLAIGESDRFTHRYVKG